MLKRFRFTATAFVILLWGSVFAAAQDVESNGAESPSPPPAQESKLQQPVELSEVYLEDLDGIWVPAMSMADFLDYKERAEGIDSSLGKVPYNILSLDALGNVIGSRVKLTVTLKIHLDPSRKRWIRIPLRFEQAALGAESNDANLAQHQIRFEALEPGEGASNGRRGYVLWLQGDGKEREETVTLDLDVPLSGIGKKRELTLSVPTEITKSHLKLTVPVPDVLATVPAGTVLEQGSDQNGNTELTLRGFRGTIDLQWQRATGKTADAAPILTSTGEIKVAVAPDKVEFDATLSVSAVSPRGHELTGFEVRLPVGATLVKDDTSTDYTVTEIPSSNDKPDTGRLVEVAFTKPVSGPEPAKVKLRAISDVAAIASDDGLLPLAGFEVLRAIDPSGSVDVRGLGDWVVRCEPGRGVKRTAQGAEDQALEGFIDGFTYFEQPFVLAAKIYPKQVRVSVEPSYNLSIEPDVANLSATLKYAVRGDKDYQLKVAMNGWEFDRVGPESRVMPEACQVNSSGTLLIELQDGVMNEFDISLEAHRTIDPAKRSLELPMPRPLGASVPSTALVVSPADNMELREDHEKTKGLERQKIPPSSNVELPEVRQERLYYRGTGEGSESVVFAALASVRKQEISAELSTDVRIAPTIATIAEKLVYQVKYEPTASLTILAPANLEAKYTLDGEAVAAVATGEPSPMEGMVLREILLRTPRQGQLELVADYTVPIGELEPLTSVLCVIPLLVPKEASFTGHRLQATIDSGIGVWQDRAGPGKERVNPWQEVRHERGAYNVPTVIEFTAQTPEPRIVMLLHPRDPDTFGSAVVHSAWIQTWMNAHQRGDRAVYRFVSDREHLVLTLPAGANTDAIQVLLDGKELSRENDYTVSSDLSLTVNLAPEQASRQRVLDVRFLCKSRPAQGKMQIELPRLAVSPSGVANNVWVRRCYWQLILPSNEHVVTVPNDYTPEYRWDWNGLWWGRVPVLEQSDLEALLHATSEEPVPEAMSRYLFSKFGPVKSVELATASRTWIVAISSGIALMIGLLVIYVPILRRPLFGLLLAIAIVSVALVRPGASLLAAQAAGMGLVFSLLGAVLYRGVARRRRRTVRRDMASSVFDRGSTRAQFGSSEVEILRSTATEPDAAAVQAPDR